MSALEPHIVDRKRTTGWIEVICGSMFSGKTEELIRRLRRAEIAGQSVETFTPTEGPVGTEIEIELSGVGWTIYENAPFFVYDNKPLGYVCGTAGDDKEGVVEVEIPAAGEPGWHFITPIVEGTVPIPTRPQTYTMSHQSGEGDNANQDDSVRVLTQDGLHVDVDVTVRYRVTPRDAPRFHEEYRDLPTAETRLIRPTVRSVLRTEGGNIDVTDIYTGEGQTRLKLAVEGALKNETEGSGIVIESVQIRNVRLPTEYANSIEQKKVKQQKIEEAEYEIQVAEKNKDPKVQAVIAADKDVKYDRVMHAIDLVKSGTRREELLIPEAKLRRIWILPVYVIEAALHHAMIDDVLL